MKCILIVFSLCVFVACSTSAKNSAYQSQQDFDTPRPLPLDEMPYQPMFTSGDGNNVIAQAIIMGIAMGVSSIINSEEPRQDLLGKCWYGDINKPALASQCIHAKVELVDEQDLVASTTTTNERGEFRFYIPQNKDYTLQVVDRKGRRAVLDKKVTRSNMVSIYLKP